jgi:hypothetical protein
VTLGVDTRKTHKTFIGIRRMKTTAWRLDTLSSPDLSRFPLALSPKMKKTRSCTSCEGTHVTSGINTRQTPSNLTGIRMMETTAWQLDA